MSEIAWGSFFFFLKDIDFFLFKKPGNSGGYAEREQPLVKATEEEEIKSQGEKFISLMLLEELTIFLTRR